MVTESEARAGLDLRLARQEAGLQQAELAAMLEPPIDVHLISYWERGQALPTASQLGQLEEIFGKRLAALASEATVPRSFDRRKLGSRDYPRLAEFAQGLLTLQRRLGVPDIAKLAALLNVPPRTLTAAPREELPTHVKAVIAAVLEWEGRAGLAYGLLSPTQRDKVDEIARNLRKGVLFKPRPLPKGLPGRTRRVLEGAPYEWQKADRARKRAKAVVAEQRTSRPLRGAAKRQATGRGQNRG